MSMRFRSSSCALVCMFCILLVIGLLSVSLNIHFLNRESRRAIFLTTEYTPNSYSIEVETSRPVLFALQFQKQLYVVTEDSTPQMQTVKLFAPSICSNIDKAINEGKTEITIKAFSKKFWFINRQLGAW